MWPTLVQISRLPTTTTCPHPRPQRATSHNNDEERIWCDDMTSCNNGDDHVQRDNATSHNDNDECVQHDDAISCNNDNERVQRDGAPPPPSSPWANSHDQWRALFPPAPTPSSSHPDATQTPYHQQLQHQHPLSPPLLSSPPRKMQWWQRQGCDADNLNDSQDTATVMLSPHLPCPYHLARHGGNNNKDTTRPQQLVRHNHGHTHTLVLASRRDADMTSATRM